MKLFFNISYLAVNTQPVFSTMLQKADLNILEYKPIVEDRFVPNDLRERIQKENIPEEIHYDLLYYYFDVFIFNSEKSQLIITSQETTLLSQNLINENRGVGCREKQRNCFVKIFSRRLFRVTQESVSL